MGRQGPQGHTVSMRQKLGLFRSFPEPPEVTKQIHTPLAQGWEPSGVWEASIGHGDAMAPWEGGGGLTTAA